MPERVLRDDESFSTEKEREAQSDSERENHFYYFNRVGSKKLFSFCLALSYSAHLSIDVHCSNEAKKNTFSSTVAWLFLVFWWS